MKNFKLKIIGTEEYKSKAKKERKKMYDDGIKLNMIIETLFKSFPKDIKLMIYKDLTNYFNKELKEI